jgi:hypothetical protein
MWSKWAEKGNCCWTTVVGTGVTTAHTVKREASGTRSTRTLNHVSQRTDRWQQYQASCQQLVWCRAVCMF